MFKFEGKTNINPKYWGVGDVWIIYIANTLQIQQQIIAVKLPGFSLYPMAIVFPREVLL